MMSKYGQAALDALKLIRSGEFTNPADAWNHATTRIFGAGTSSQRKSCPKAAFLGLCRAAMLHGVRPGGYTNSKCSARYATDAVTFLKRQPELVDNPKKLWSAVVGDGSRTHNSQMCVVIALWRANAIAAP